MGAIELFPNLPPAAATHIAAKLLNKHPPHEIAEAIEVLIDVLDMLGGDPDREDDPLEDDDPREDDDPAEDDDPDAEHDGREPEDGN